MLPESFERCRTTKMRPFASSRPRAFALKSPRPVHRGWLIRLCTNSGKYFNGTDPHEITAS